MTAPRTVLFTETGRLGGGSFEGLYLTLKALDRERFRPVVVFTTHTRYVDLVRDLGIPVHRMRDLVLSLDVNRRVQKWMERVQEYSFCRVPPLGAVAARLCHRALLRGLAALCRAEGVELLYSNNQVNRTLAMPLLAQRLGLPLVAHFRSPGAESFCPPKRDYVERWTTRFITISRQVENYWRHHGLRAPMALIPNGLPKADPAPLDLHREFCISGGRRVVVILARLIWEKAHEFLLDGFAEMLRRRTDAALLIVGNGPRRPQVEARIRELKLEDHVVLAGYDPRGKDIAAAADLVVQPSSTDSFSRAVMEAMRAGTPTAITDKGSALEAVEPGVHSLVMAYGDVSGLAEALEVGLFDDAVRDRLAENAGRLIAERFDLDAQTRMIEAVMDQALARGPGPYPPPGEG